MRPKISFSWIEVKNLSFFGVRFSQATITAWSSYPPPLSCYKMNHRTSMSQQVLLDLIFIYAVVPTCPASLGFFVSVTSYCLMSPWIQLLRYRYLSSNERRMSVIKPVGKISPWNDNWTSLEHVRFVRDRKEKEHKHRELSRFFYNSSIVQKTVRVFRF